MHWYFWSATCRWSMFTVKRSEPKLSRFNPAEGLKIFQASLAQLIKSLLK